MEPNMLAIFIAVESEHSQEISVRIFIAVSGETQVVGQRDAINTPRFEVAADRIAPFDLTGTTPFLAPFALLSALRGIIFLGLDL